VNREQLLNEAKQHRPTYLYRGRISEQDREWLENNGCRVTCYAIYMSGECSYSLHYKEHQGK